MATKLVTQDEKYEKVKARGSIKLQSKEMKMLNSAVDRAVQNVRSRDIFTKYSALKGATNYIERIANFRDLRPSNLGEYDPVQGTIKISGERKKPLDAKKPKRRSH
jgi:hypothetical protein